MFPFTKEEKKREYVDVEHILPRLYYEGPCRRDIEIADYYGFRLLATPKPEAPDEAPYRANERAALIRAYLESGLDGCTQPALLSYTTKVPYKPEYELTLSALGTEESIAEVLLIHTASTILRERGFENTLVALNSIGGPGSIENYQTQLTSFCREHMNTFDECCRQTAKERPFLVLTCTNDTCREVTVKAPRPVAHLTEQSRTHFYDVIESLESLGVPYTIDDMLVGDPDTVTHTIFEIRESDSDESEGTPRVLARGERYDRLAKRAGVGRHIPAVSAHLTFNTGRSRAARETLREYKVNRPRSVSVYIVQLGTDARRTTLAVAEHLRGARIPLATALTENNLTQQLAYADQLAVPIVIIIGQKEVTDGTVIVRRRETSAQEAVPQENLVNYLKRLRVL